MTHRRNADPTAPRALRLCADLSSLLAAMVLVGCASQPLPEASGDADYDRDGVRNALDRCPQTPPAAYGGVGPDGCALYSDGDDVPDYLDACPGTPNEVSVDEQGCPFDSDGDGVADHRDQCPGTPKNSRVDAKGCPAKDERLVSSPDFSSGNVRAGARHRWPWTPGWTENHSGS